RLRDRLPAADDGQPDPAALAAAIADLDAWLAAHPPRLHRWQATTAAALLIAGTATLTLLAGLHPAALAGAVAIIAAGGYALWPALDPRQPEAAAQERAREAFQRRGLTGPTAWDRSGVQDRRQALEEARRRAEEATAAAGERRARAEEVAQWEEEARGLTEALAPRLAPAGLDPQHAPRAAGRWLQEAANLTRARAEAEGAAAEARTAEDGATEKIGAIARLLTDLGQPVGGDRDLDTLRTAVEQLRSRAEAYRAAQRDAAEARRTAEREAEQQQRQEQAIRALFEQAGLATDDDAALEKRLERLPGWQAARKREEGAETLLHRSRAGLTGEDDLLHRAEGGEEDALAAELRTLQAQAEAADDHLTRVRDLEHELARAREERPLEAAEAGVQAARDRRDAVRDDVLERRAAAWLLEDVAREHRAEHRPALLERADGWLADFSRGAFRLELAEDGALEAVDTAAGTHRALAELSTGTRMQLLIAVRAAWALAGEEGREPLPLFLDEALTTTDPERFEAVATSLRTLAAETDRQVFYLTAQPADIGRWGLAPQDPHVIDLAAVRGRAIAAPPEALAAPVDQRPPAPEAGEEAADYAHRLGVPPIDPWADAGAIHPFYLLRDDLETLHRAITAGGDRLGRLESLLERPGTARLLGDPETLRTRIHFARAWLAEWRVGRGRPVTRAVLADPASPTARSTKNEEVIAQAEAVGGDADHLLEALRNGAVKGLRRNLMDELADYLDEHGYRDERPASTPEDCQRAALAAVGPNMEDADALATLAGWLEAGLSGKGTEPAAPGA
ncbi:MAG: ATP-binding protein, partial [Pseudomonadota bacterium]